MSGNTFGVLFRVTAFGESHGAALGCVIDGCPAGVPVDKAIIARELERRKPGGDAPDAAPASTTRREADEPDILSGVFEGKTLGTPIAVIIRNHDHYSGDYDALRDVYRPGHADWTWEAKFGVRDHRGGGRSSGRETVGRVAAGAVAKSFLSQYGVVIQAWSSSIAGVAAPAPGDPSFSLALAESNSLRMPAPSEALEEILAKIERLRLEGDSGGGVVTCVVRGVPPGLGEPVFDKLDARLAQAMLSLGAAKGVEFGAGFASADSQGSLLNDTPYQSAATELLTPAMAPDGVPPMSFKTNNAGGVLGGISNGMPLEFRVAFKPVPSISKKQTTIDRAGSVRELVVKGRHDVCVVPRAVPVVEAMTALVLADMFLLQWRNWQRN
ncbi:MAG: chorismate synthase [Treponema sp.]|nr:chorismate synthase [Treponema sp.]